MVLNAYLPNIAIDPETYTVTVDGEVLHCEPAKVLPMAQRYFLLPRTSVLIDTDALDAAALSTYPNSLPQIAIAVDRHKLARRRWRGLAQDGQDFGFDLIEPLQHGDPVLSVSRRFIASISCRALLALAARGGP